MHWERLAAGAVSFRVISMPRPARILFVITDLDLGGSPKVLRDVALGLASERGGRVQFAPHVCALAPIGSAADTGPRGAIARDLRKAGIAVHSLDARGPLHLPAALRRYRTVLAQVRPDLVYSILVHANTLATLGKAFCNCPLIQSLHTLQPEPEWHWQLSGFLARWADAVVAPSQPILNRLATYGHFSSGLVIPNGIDVTRFADAEPAEQSPWRHPHELVLGYVGRFDPVKRLDALLGATALLHARGIAAKLILVGYGPEEAALRELSQTLHLAPHVHFAGPASDPERWYKCFSLHCLPSPVEGFGLTLAESLAAGTPVVAVENGATRAIVRAGFDGELVQRPSVSLLADAITAVARMRQDGFDPAPARQRMGEKFSVRQMVVAHAKFLEKILA